MRHQFSVVLKDRPVEATSICVVQRIRRKQLGRRSAGQAPILSARAVVPRPLQPIAQRPQLNRQSKQTVWDLWVAKPRIRHRRHRQRRAHTSCSSTTAPRQNAPSVSGSAQEREQSCFRLSCRIALQIASKVSRTASLAVAVAVSVPRGLANEPLTSTSAEFPSTMMRRRRRSDPMAARPPTRPRSTRSGPPRQAPRASRAPASTTSRIPAHPAPTRAPPVGGRAGTTPLCWTTTSSSSSTARPSPQ